MDVLPTLTMDGFVTNRATVLTKLFEYFLASDGNQSNTFHGSIYSLKYILRNSSSPSFIEDEIRRQLKEMYLNFFSSVEVTTSTSVAEESEGGNINILIDITAGYNGQIYTLSRDVQYSKADPVAFDKILDNLYYAETKGNN